MKFEENDRPVQLRSDLENRLEVALGRRVTCVSRVLRQSLRLSDLELISVCNSVPQVSNHFEFRRTVEVIRVRESVPESDEGAPKPDSTEVIGQLRVPRWQLEEMPVLGAILAPDAAHRNEIST